MEYGGGYRYKKEAKKAQKNRRKTKKPRKESISMRRKIK